MTHKRNLTLTALAWAALITIAFVVFPRIYHGTIGLFYAPSLALSVILSHYFGGNPHSPSASVGWISFVANTIVYAVVFLIAYVIVLEFYLLRRVLHHLDDAEKQLTTEKPDSRQALEEIGRAISELEARRRKHFLLQPLDLPDLGEAPHLLAARAISKQGNSGPVKALLKRLKRKLASQTNAEKSAVLLGKVKGEATALLAQNDATKRDDGNDAGSAKK